MSNTELDIDSSKVLNMFAELSQKKQIKVYRTALKKGAAILTRETRKNLKSSLGPKVSNKNRWNGKTLQSGIKARASKEGEEVKVHIMGDFRLKFFEKGTEGRQIKKSLRKGNRKYKYSEKKDRGAMTQRLYFFRAAKQSKESEIFSSINNLITQSILRVAK